MTLLLAILSASAQRNNFSFHPEIPSQLCLKLFILIHDDGGTLCGISVTHLGIHCQVQVRFWATILSPAQRLATSRCWFESPQYCGRSAALGKQCVRVPDHGAFGRVLAPANWGMCSESPKLLTILIRNNRIESLHHLLDFVRFRTSTSP